MNPDQIKHLHQLFADLSAVYTFHKSHVPYLIRINKLTNKELYTETLHKFDSCSAKYYLYALHHEWQSRFII